MTDVKQNRAASRGGFFSLLQRVGRAFMLPIALLPIAGLLLGVGASLTNATMLAEYGLTGVMGEEIGRAHV